MSDWNAGYVTEIGYPYGYFPELCPLRSELAFLNKGIRLPKIRTACELGFGQGLSTNIHAAGTEVEWYGTDFNPAQAGFAQELAEASGANADLRDQAFDEFCSRDDLPNFDFIGLHGIWSWVSEENRTILVDFIRRKLNAGGIIYISYNSMPGWASFAPIRHLMMEHSKRMSSAASGIVNRIDGAIDFIKNLNDTKPIYSTLNSDSNERFEKLNTHNRHYLAHEYFNRDWHPMHFATVASYLESAKLDYACSAHYLDHIDVVALTPEQQAFIQELPDVVMKESTRDYMINQNFRRDYWVKGARRISPLEQTAALKVHRIVLICYRPEISLKLVGPKGEVKMSEEIYGPILDVLGDYKVITIGQLHEKLSPKGIDFNNIVEAILILASDGQLTSAQDPSTIEKVAERTRRLNLKILSKAHQGSEIGSLVSPVTGSGIAITRIQQLFVLASLNGKMTPTDWAESTWSILSAQGHALQIEGKPLEGDEANLNELISLADEFEKTKFPILKSLKVI